MKIPFFPVHIILDETRRKEILNARADGVKEQRQSSNRLVSNLLHANAGLIKYLRKGSRN